MIAPNEHKLFNEDIINAFEKISDAFRKFGVTIEEFGRNLSFLCQTMEPNNQRKRKGLPMIRKQAYIKNNRNKKHRSDKL